MSEPTSGWRSRLTEPSSAAGLAALLALIVPGLASFGFDQPIVVDTDGVIIKGQGRREASLRLGLDKVPVLVRGDLSVTEIKAARLADNRTAQSPWDEDLLRVELAALLEQDFDLGLTGFDFAEIEELLAAAEAEQAGLTEDDDVPEGACTRLAWSNPAPTGSSPTELTGAS